jgi:hypothetical protein
MYSVNILMDLIIDKLSPVRLNCYLKCPCIGMCDTPITVCVYNKCITSIYREICEILCCLLIYAC